MIVGDRSVLSPLGDRVSGTVAGGRETDQPAEEAAVRSSVASQIRSLIAKHGSGLVCWEDLAGGDPDQRAAIQLVLSNLVLNRYGPDRDIPLQRAAQSIYHYGHGKPDPYQVALKWVGSSPEGVGYAEQSAAHYLALGPEPELATIAFPRRIRSQPSGIDAHWVSRAGCVGRVMAYLNLPAVCVLEVLRDPELIEAHASASVAVAKIGDLLEREQITARDLVAASATEPPVVREGLRNLLEALGRDEAQRIKPTPNTAVRDRAFLGGGDRGERS